VLRKSHWSPQSPEQFEAYITKADELFYGGRAGAGKTDLLLGLASTDHYRSMIFRRVYPNLEAIIFRGKEMFPSKTWNGTSKTWSGTIGGSERHIQLGAMQFLEDRNKYQGRPFDLMGFDEVCEFLYEQFTFVKGWNRTTRPNQRVRVVATGNPPNNQEGMWVIDYWAPWLDRTYSNSAQPGELRWFIIINGESIETPNSDPIMEKGEQFIPSSRTFIPGNMIHHLKGTNYERNLHALPEPLRSQLLYGDFTLGQEDDQWQIIPTDWVLLAMDRWKHTQIPLTVDSAGNVRPTPLQTAGVDVARGGKDDTIIAPRFGNYVAQLIKIPGKDTPDSQSVVNHIVKNIQKGTRINIDIIGVGAGPFDFLDGFGYEVFAVDSREKSHATDKTGKLPFTNFRAEIWWNARELLDPESGEDIALPDDRRLLQHLTAPRWKLVSSGIQVESKEEIKKRIGQSPDDGDAVVMALFNKQRVGILFGGSQES